MELKDLVEGEIYYTKQHNSIYIYKYLKYLNSLDSNSNFIAVNEKRFCYNNNCGCLISREILRHATNIEKQWLNLCIKANKYVECPLVEENILENIIIW